MKKLLCFVLALILSFSFVSCGTSKPESTVKTFCEGLKSFDSKKASSCMSDDYVSPSGPSLMNPDMDNPVAAYMHSHYKKWASEISYKITAVVSMMIKLM